MANFSTHLQFSTIGSGLVSTLFLSSQHITVSEAVACWVAGSVGGILPDIDSDNSYGLSILFGLLTMIACIFVTWFGINQWPITWVWVACLITFVVMQFIIRKIFTLLTVHRGVFHSVLAGAFFTVATTVMASQLGMRDTGSWFVGIFTGFGYFLHLLLDEIYSVDFMGVRVKRSFGTALKLFDYTNVKSAAFIVVLTGLTSVYLPTSTRFASIILNPNTYTDFAEKLIYFG